MEVTSIAKAVAEENKPFLKLLNPYFKGVYNNSLDIFKIPELKTQYKNKFYWNDSIVPAKPLAKIAALQKGFLVDKRVYFIIGITQLIVSMDEHAQKIVRVIPIKHEYMAFVIKKTSEKEGRWMRLRIYLLACLNVPTDMQLFTLGSSQHYRFADKAGPV